MVSIHALVRVRRGGPILIEDVQRFNPRTRESATDASAEAIASPNVSIHALVRVRL